MSRPRITRSDETRDKEIREFVDALSQSPLDVSVYEIPDGMEYGWIRISTMGEVDEGNQVEKARLGWKAVPSDRHANIGSNTTIFGEREDSNRKTFIEYRGLVLCERSLAIGDAIRRAQARENAEVMSSTPGMEQLATGYVRANKQDWQNDGFAG